MLILIGIAVVALLALFFFSTYKIVGTNEAHVIVFMGRGRTVKTPIEGGKTSYFYIPFLMKRYVLPLTNVKLDINDIPLNDNKMAPFVCDVVTWLHIQDPIKASERLNFEDENAFGSLHNDLTAIVQAVARAAAMKQEILDIMRDRATFANGVSTEVDIILSQWGVKLVNLEVNEIRDYQGSNVIQNYEAMRKAQVQSATRIEIAQRDREAIEAEQSNRQKAEVATAESQKVYMTAQMSRDKAVGIAQQESQQEIARAEQKTNEVKVEALRTAEVGKASVVKQATVTKAEGDADAIKITGERQAQVVELTGRAEAAAIEAKGLAEAKAKDAMAKALKEYNDAATVIEKIKAQVEIQKAFAYAYAQMAEKAEIKIVTSGEGGNILGLPMNARTGADIGQMIEALGTEKVSEIIKTVTGK